MSFSSFTFAFSNHKPREKQKNQIITKIERFSFHGSLTGAQDRAC